MSKITTTVLVGLGIAASLTLSGAAAARETSTPSQECLARSALRGWSAADKDTLYVTSRTNDVYRVDLAHGFQGLTQPGYSLASVGRGVDRICSPQDIELRVENASGMNMLLKAKAITKLTPQQAAALTKARP
ncbi:DUF6491 family protein [Caulobacter sp. BP25]|uniref:DUF6491 family protein n=1 Tax=Caulobacter sp. BP25 TaxID=2048900 RepID=UPI000C12D49C|nr:DUF6491 family protein [Caulobacter sp. BP25]PHY18993.1 hypothetical protein CSW59_11200 [Caulobacter sp. BP25]